MGIEGSAKWINDHRVFPRIFVSSYLGFYVYAWLMVFEWFTVFDWNGLPDDAIVGSVAATAVAGFPAIILGLMGKMLKELLTSYWNNGPSNGV